MKKLKLNLDELKVESFEVNSNLRKNGTLFGQASDQRCESAGLADCGGSGAAAINQCPGGDDPGTGGGGGLTVDNILCPIVVLPTVEGYTCDAWRNACATDLKKCYCTGGGNSGCPNTTFC